VFWYALFYKIFKPRFCIRTYCSAESHHNLGIMLGIISFNVSCASRNKSRNALSLYQSSVDRCGFNAKPGLKIIPNFIGLNKKRQFEVIVFFRG